MTLEHAPDHGGQTVTCDDTAPPPRSLEAHAPTSDTPALADQAGPHPTTTGSGLGAPPDAGTGMHLAPGPSAFGSATPVGPVSGSANRVDRYTLLSELGRGGMGVVYRAWDPHLDRTVALKMLLWGGIAGEVRRRRFVREAQAIARLEHPAIVTVYDSGVHQGCPFYTMDFVAGPTLQQRLEQGGAFTPKEALKLLAVVARALHHAHQRGIVHRDIKPANILLEEGKGPRITDFGIALLAFGEGDLTETGQIVGTPAYMAPEQAEGLPGETGPRADVYSLGAVLYHMLAGAAPFERDGQTLPLYRRPVEAPSLRRTDLSVPREVDLICRRAMSTDPADRYPSALALAEDAERFVRGEPVQASAPSLSRRLRWQLRRSRALLTGVGLTVLLTLALAGAWRAIAQSRAETLQRAREQVAMERLEGLRAQVASLSNEGRNDEATQTLQAFLELPEIQRTRAAFLAQTLAGEQASAAGRTEQALEHFARAWLVALTEEDQARALVAMGSVFEVTGDWARLRALDPLLASVVSAKTLPGLEHFRRLTALSARDLLTLTRLLKDRSLADFGPLLRHLGSMQPTGYQPSELLYTATGRMVAFGPDARSRTSALLLARDGLAGSPGKLPLKEVFSPEGTTFNGDILDLGLWQGQQRVALTLRQMPGDRPLTGIYRVDGQALRPLLEANRSGIGAACTADLDHDGQVETYVGTGRQLFAVVSGPGGTLRLNPAHAETNLSNSDIQHLLAADLDGDGYQELVAVTDGWRSYEVRVFRAGKQPGSLELVAAKRLGPLWNAAPMPLADGSLGLAVVRYKDQPNTRSFPSRTPSGVPVGVYILKLEGRSLDIVEVVQAPFQNAVLGRLVAGDFDGDGRSDLAVQVQMSHSIRSEFQREDSYIQLITRRQDGHLAQLTLPGLVPWHAQNLDGDPAAELLVRDQYSGALWALGLEGASLPTIPRPAENASSRVGRTADDTWGRIEALASLGLTHVGARELLNLAATTPDAQAAARILLRAASLLEQSGDLEGATTLLVAAVNRAPNAINALKGLADILHKSRRHEEEHKTLTRALASPSFPASEQPAAQVRVAQLRRYIRRHEESLAFQGELDARWLFDAPYQLWRDARSGALVVRAYPGQGNLARLPLVWDGQPLSLELEVTLQRAEWGSILELGIRQEGAGPGEYAAAIRFGSGGGGDQLTTSATLLVPGLNTSPVWEVPSRNPATPLAMKLRLEVDPVKGEAHLSANGKQRSYPLNKPFSSQGDRFELFLAGNPSSPPEYGLMEVGLEGLTIRGAHLRPPTFDPAQQAWRSLMEGDHAKARQLASDMASRHPVPAALITYLAHCQSGAQERCLSELTRLLKDPQARGPELDAILRNQLRSSPSLVFSALVTRAGFEAFQRLEEAWGGPAAAHPDDPTVAIALSVCPSEVDLTHLPGPRTLDQALLELRLLVRQVRALEALGQYDSVISRLEALRQRGETLRKTRGGDERQVEVSQALSQLELLAARAYAHKGLPVPVRDHLRRALERSPVPRLMAEEMAVIPEIEAFLQDPAIFSILNPTTYTITSPPTVRGLE